MKWPPPHSGELSISFQPYKPVMATGQLKMLAQCSSFHAISTLFCPQNIAKKFSDTYTVIRCNIYIYIYNSTLLPIT
ncbi:beta-amyrin synthase 1 [Phtheirospermum japonicum]|uniref:Beta-amyrin synthase 1 n=1 Tax=Phtheirospermum japonicum TaxID=374723 RepID=A0A830DJN8_9LAMI|nr:beta-amyrin synthase 1 [Phtheirospermum japonicum]